MVTFIPPYMGEEIKSNAEKKMYDVLQEWFPWHSTMCLCLGLSDATELIERTDGMEAMFITEDMKMHYHNLQTVYS